MDRQRHQSADLASRIRSVLQHLGGLRTDSISPSLSVKGLPATDKENVIFLSVGSSATDKEIRFPYQFAN